MTNLTERLERLNEEQKKQEDISRNLEIRIKMKEENLEILSKDVKPYADIDELQKRISEKKERLLSIVENMEKALTDNTTDLSIGKLEVAEKPTDIMDIDTLSLESIDMNVNI